MNSKSGYEIIIDLETEWIRHTFSHFRRKAIRINPLFTRMFLWPHLPESNDGYLVSSVSTSSEVAKILSEQIYCFLLVLLPVLRSSHESRDEMAKFVMSGSYFLFSWIRVIFCQRQNMNLSSTWNSLYIRQ